METYDPSQCLCWGTFGGYTCAPLDDSRFAIDNFPFNIDEHLTRPLKANIVTGRADTLRVYRTFEVVDDAALDKECVDVIMGYFERSVKCHGESVVQLAWQDLLDSVIFLGTRRIEESRSLARIVSRIDTALSHSDPQDSLYQGRRHKLWIACQNLADRFVSEIGVRSLLPL